MRIFARKCTAAEVDNKVAADFCEQYHRSDFPKKYVALKSWGLFHAGDLVAVLAVSNPRTKAMQRSYSREILRLCFKTDVRVVGGASKLIKTFIKKEQPWDFFTYQSTGGEAGSVYLESGMRLVRREKPKRVLVKNGKTFETAENNRRDWFSLQQVVSRGPDALLKTNLGEVFREDGSRYTNVELFTEFLEYHLEIIPGDRVFDWHDEKRWFYTYRISASDSEKYYFGRHVFPVRQKTPPTEQQLLNDGYFGSGGTKFKNWLAKHEKNVHKEILGVFATFGEAVRAEEELVGNLYKEDANCLNSKPGGLSGGISSKLFTQRECPKHGVTKFSGDVCCRCIAEKSVRVAICPVHGETKFSGEKCRKCFGEAKISEKECPVHGVTTFEGDKCCKCTASGVVNFQVCPVHGQTKFKKNTCMKCANVSKISLQKCPVHGETTFEGDKCCRCVTKRGTTLGVCSTHGETKFQGGKCCKCRPSNVYVAECPVHGKTKFQGSQCCRCRNLQSAKNRKTE